jgi:hypothetical protein
MLPEAKIASLKTERETEKERMKKEESLNAAGNMIFMSNKIIFLQVKLTV